MRIFHELVELISYFSLGQIPEWMNLESVVQDSESSDSPPPHLVVHHHSEIFSNTSYLPIFNRQVINHIISIHAFNSEINSLAIESQLPHVPVTTEHFLYSNDDMFFFQHVSAADFGSMISGPVFRIERHIDVWDQELSDVGDDPEGEWNGLRHANWLLSQFILFISCF
jgi:hypothetical protein